MFAEDERILRECIIDGKYLALSKRAHQVFENLKNKIIESNRLAIFNESLEKTIACDASGTCLGATLSPKGNRETRTICYTSRILSEVEQKYFNTQRKLLAVVWAIKKKFWFYVENRRVKVFTDHKPLVERCKLTEE
jgi:RNase H-like domain found in reverse transcriptase